MMVFTHVQYRDRVLGAWVGKLVGAMVGGPLDGQKQPRLTDGGQVQESAGELGTVRGVRPKPSDIVALQLISLRALAGAGPQLSAHDLGYAWLRHLGTAEHGYGYVLASLRRDLEPPLSGVFDNPFRESLGAMGRADVWGLVAPGDPEVAAAYARQDAGVDHTGVGVEAAVLTAAMVSAGFVETEPGRVLEVGLRFLAQESRVGRAVRDVMRWQGELADWQRTREMLLRAYGSEYVHDAVVAAGLVALSLLEGAQQADRALTTAARCGWSTGTTCMVVGAVSGVMVGGERAPGEWMRAAPPEVEVRGMLAGLPSSAPLSAVVTETCDVGRMVIRSQSLGRVELVEEAPEPATQTLEVGETGEFVRELLMGSYVTYRRRGDLGIHVDYDGPPTIGYEKGKRLTITVSNLGARRVDIRTRIVGRPGFVITTNAEAVTLPEGGNVSFSATVSAPAEWVMVGPVNPFTLYVSVDSGPEIAAPVVLVGEGLWYASGPYGDFDQSHPPEHPGVLSGEAALGGEGWQGLSVAEPAVNLVAGLSGERGCYYLATDVLTERARRVRLRVGCNDGTKVWVNAQEVWRQHEHRPADGRVSADEVLVDLREGWNRLVIKMAQCSPRRFLSVALKDQEGEVLVDIANTWPRPR